MRDRVGEVWVGLLKLEMERPLLVVSALPSKHGSIARWLCLDLVTGEPIDRYDDPWMTWEHRERRRRGVRRLA